MPRLTVSAPKYRHHKPSGQAVVTLNGKDVYLGRYGTPESKREYNRLVAEWRLAGQQHARSSQGNGGPTVDELIVAYHEHASTYYRKNGRATTTQQHIRDALRPLHTMYGQTPAAEFGPLALEALRQQMAETGDWCRNTINKHIQIIRRMFRWGVAKELVPPHVHQGLQAVDGLRRGRSDARESERVKPVPDAFVDIVLKHVPPPVAAMIRLQRLTGMRPGEVVIMRGCDIDTTGRIWSYTPASHKTEHHGRSRVIHFGPQAQAVLRGWLKPDLQAYLFNPEESEAARNAERSKNRRTPMTPSQSRRQPRERRSRPPRDHYTQESYRRAIHRACDAAFPPPDHLQRKKIRRRTGLRWENDQEWQKRLGDDRWAELKHWQREHRWSPNQLRHNAATHLRKHFGIEAARVVLGHSSAAVTEVYAEVDSAKAAEIMASVG